jgi:hypothetical protein
LDTGDAVVGLTAALVTGSLAIQSIFTIFGPSLNDATLFAPGSTGRF